MMKVDIVEEYLTLYGGPLDGLEFRVSAAWVAGNPVCTDIMFPMTNYPVRYRRRQDDLSKLDFVGRS